MMTPVCVSCFFCFCLLTRLQRWSWSCCQEGFWSSPSSPSSPPSCSGPGSSWRPTTGKKHTHTQTGQTGNWSVLTGVSEQQLWNHADVAVFCKRASGIYHLFLHCVRGARLLQRPSFRHITLLWCNELVPTWHQTNRNRPGICVYDSGVRHLV